MADIVKETELAIKSKQMRIHNCLPEGICIKGNWSLVYSIFRNLIDNAINYAGVGTVIEVFAEEREKHWAFTIRDNGTGVSEEHLPRIFERFYRIDKGRSRQRQRAGDGTPGMMGGTGLGLAIVKNAVLLHGGQIVAGRPTEKGGTGAETNAVGSGLQFNFTLKKS